MLRIHYNSVVWQYIISVLVLGVEFDQNPFPSRISETVERIYLLSVLLVFLVFVEDVGGDCNKNCLLAESRTVVNSSTSTMLSLRELVLLLLLGMVHEWLGFLEHLFGNLYGHFRWGSECLCWCRSGECWGLGTFVRGRVWVQS